jgi:hypothetical protein
MVLRLVLAVLGMADARTPMISDCQSAIICNLKFAITIPKGMPAASGLAALADVFLVTIVVGLGLKVRSENLRRRVTGKLGLPGSRWVCLTRSDRASWLRR